MPSLPADAAWAPAPSLRVDYLAGTVEQALADPGTLAAFVFGTGPGAASADPRALTVPLQPLGDAPVEAWRVPGPVTHGRDGPLRWSADGALLFGAVEIGEGAAGGIVLAAAQAYEALHGCLARHGYPYPLRIWNYLDAITEGEGDLERYRQFCVGRARGLGSFDVGRLPAATAIGCRDGRRVLQVYWLAAKAPGTPLENPRQLAAYRYPRQYGPQSPSFARAMLPPADSGMPLLLSGTASVVGHETRHAGDLVAQLGETFANFESLLGEAHRRRPALPARFGPGTRLKAYVREPAERAAIDAALARLAPGVPILLLHADICRRDLHIEIDGVHA